MCHFKPQPRRHTVSTVQLIKFHSLLPEPNKEYQMGTFYSFKLLENYKPYVRFSYNEIFTRKISNHISGMLGYGRQHAH